MKIFRSRSRGPSGMTLWHLSVWKLPSQFVLDNSRDPEDNCLGDMRSRYWDKLDHNITQSHTSPPGPASCRLVVLQTFESHRTQQTSPPVNTKRHAAHMIPTPRTWNNRTRLIGLLTLARKKPLRIAGDRLDDCPTGGTALKAAVSVCRVCMT